MISLFQLPLPLRRCSHTNLFFVSLTDSKTEAVGGDGWSDPQIPGHGGEPLSTSSPAPAASVAPCRHGVAASAC